MLANYHTHTYRCKHASGEDRDYVEAALKAGLKVLGFSDHCPWVYPSGFVSGIRMIPPEVPGYFESLLALKEEYKKDIQIYIGFETEFTEELLPGQDELLKGYPLDYMILGQHFLGPDDMMPYTGSPTDSVDFLSDYVDSVIKGMGTGRFLYLAHPDLIHFTGPGQQYDLHIERLCREMKKNDWIMEFNVLGYADRRHYPTERFLEIAGQIGNRYILGTDAHAPEQLLNFRAVEGAEKLCDKYHINRIDGTELFS